MYNELTLNWPYDKKERKKYQKTFFLLNHLECLDCDCVLGFTIDWINNNFVEWMAWEDSLCH